MALVFGTLGLAGCSTTQSRISDRPDLFRSLPPNDQQLVSAGQIRTGMSQSAVWLAWGTPEQKTVGMIRGNNAETWIYLTTTTAPYAGYGYGYGYGFGYPYGGFGPGFYGGGVFRTHHGRRFAYFGDPFYDPFYYSAIPPTVSYPNKTVTFVNGRAVSFQYFIPPYR